MSGRLQCYIWVQFLQRILQHALVGHMKSQGKSTAAETVLFKTGFWSETNFAKSWNIAFFQFQFDMLRGHRQRTQASNGAQKRKTGLFFCVSLFICCQSLFLVFSSELCHEGLSSNATNSSRGMLRHKVVMWDCNKHVWRRTSLQQQQGWHFE